MIRLLARADRRAPLTLSAATSIDVLCARLPDLMPMCATHTLLPAAAFDMGVGHAIALDSFDLDALIPDRDDGRRDWGAAALQPSAACAAAVNRSLRNHVPSPIS